MVGTVYDYNILRVEIMSGELRKSILFSSNEEYQRILKMGMRVGADIEFDYDSEEIYSFR